jgi:MarR family transcriptional regulator for hemolysin
MEAAGLVTRRRDPDNRRVHQVELTGDGDAMFFALLRHVVAFDQRLRAGLDPGELSQLRQLLERLAANTAPDP